MTSCYTSEEIGCRRASDRCCQLHVILRVDPGCGEALEILSCSHVCAAILFTVSVLWYWGSKRKVHALESQKVLLADLFRIRHPADEDDLR